MAGESPDWIRVEELFHGAAELEGDARARFLERECGVDRALRDEVESLLEAERGRSDRLTGAVARAEAELRAAQPASDSPLGRRFGAYRLVRLIDTGGMGAVYEAERADREFERRVAVKLIRGGVVAPSSAERFLRERQALASLDHPNIAGLLDGGTTEEGQPYLVMELVDGRPIDRWCDERLLSIDARLALFRTVCDAVHHAHRSLIVHRDIKPANVLVTSDGVPKLLDFGIAKMLEADGELTSPSEFVLTPEYASPEQVLGAPVGVASDVYALGLLLHELLTGRKAFAAGPGGFPVLARRIVGEEPPRPSAVVAEPRSGEARGAAELARLRDSSPARLRRQLAGDLDNVVAMALRKEPDRRYASVEQLSADIERHLSGRPVIARPDTFTYRTVKFARRNAGLLATLVALVAGLVATSVVQYMGRREVLGQWNNVLRLSAAQRLHDLVAEAEQLWPATPAMVPRYEDWLSRAEALFRGLDGEPAAGDVGHRRRLEELRERVLADPVGGEPGAARAELDARLGACAVRRTGVAPTPFELDATALPADPLELNELAWSLVDPDSQDAARYGRETEALALARLALERASEHDRFLVWDTLAWASLACGLDEDALRASEAALELAPPDAKVEFERFRERLRAAVEAAQGPEERARIAALELRLAEGSRSASAEERWWHGQLVTLVRDLEDFGCRRTGLLGTGLSARWGWGVERRLEWARVVEERTVSGDAARRLWAEAIDAIADPVRCPPYAGLRIEPEVGLLPLGPDPDSGLWEFAVLQTGRPPERGPRGELFLDDESSLVLVLLPGGTFLMGAQRADPRGPNHDPSAAPEEGPVHAVTLAPFFISKYEMTQGQWLRLLGHDPSDYKAYRTGLPGRHTRLDPVERTSWRECVRVLAQLDLVLPTESQWEYAARAGTTSPWSTGDERESLVGFANLNDATVAEAQISWALEEPWLDDGYAVHAPVGSYAPNAFGLHDAHGNVWEWCLDVWEVYGADGAEPRPGDGLRLSEPDDAFRVLRGGGFAQDARLLRSAARDKAHPGWSSGAVGLRPARSLSRESVEAGVPASRSSEGHRSARAPAVGRAKEEGE